MDIAWANDFVTKTAAFVTSWTNYLSTWIVTACFSLAGLAIATELIRRAVDDWTR